MVNVLESCFWDRILAWLYLHFFSNKNLFFSLLTCIHIRRFNKISDRRQVDIR